MSPRWTKRRVAAALVALMDRLGHPRFAVAGHDRGARVVYRLALDHPERVSAYASFAVVPTLDAMEAIDHRAAEKATTGSSSPSRRTSLSVCSRRIRTL